MKINTVKTGDIACHGAYAQGKMLQHGSWHGVLPRGVTPSDCDMQYFDNAGNLLLVEFSRHHSSWHKLKRGQRLGYEHLVTIARESDRCCIAALCRHSVPSHKTICTHTDVDEFSVMICASEAGVVTTFHPFGGDYWQDFVIGFFEDPKKTMEVIRHHLEKGN